MIGPRSSPSTTRPSTTRSAASRRPRRLRARAGLLVSARAPGLRWARSRKLERDRPARRGREHLFAVATTGGLLSLVAVLGGLFPIVTVALAYFLLHERLQPLQRVGVLLALAGIPLISTY